MIKNKKGITLIALVVTIVVLLILAGIAIMALTGENGILNRAADAKLINEKGKVEEIMKMAYMGKKIDARGGTTSKETLMSEIILELRRNGYDGEDDIKTVTNAGSTYSGLNITDEDLQVIDSSGNNIDVITLEKGNTHSKTIKVNITKTAGESKVYIKIQGQYYEILCTETSVGLSEEGQTSLVGEEYNLTITPTTTNATMSIAGVTITEPVPDLVSGTEIIITATDNTGTENYTITVLNANGTTKAVNQGSVKVEFVPHHPTSIDVTSKDNVTSIEVDDELQFYATPHTSTGEPTTDTIVWDSSDTSVATIDSTGKVTAVGAGTTNITAIARDNEGDHCTSQPFTLTVTSSEVAVTFNLDGGSVNSSTANIVENELPGNPITLPKPTKTNYEFNGWDTTQNAATPSIAKTATTIEAPNSNTTYYAQWKQPSQASRTYGTAVATNTTSGTYGTLGTSVALNGGNAISVGSGTIQDNWKVFYEDSDFVYLIYGDYYPAENVQTAQDTIQLKPGSRYAYGVNDSTSRVNLLKYLRNYSGYTWSSRNDNFASGGTQYTSWSNLQTALSGLTALSGKTISIQGSPDIDLWVRSWEAKGNTDLDLTKNSYGYNIMTAGAGSNVSYYIDLSGSGNSSNGTGYYDTLYFPYRGYTTSDGEHAADACGYWLASPGGYNSKKVCSVYFSGLVGSDDYYDSRYCARPVVSIEKVV